MLKVNKRRSDNGLPKVKPCQIFDLIGGTSTGGSVSYPLNGNRS
jgi:patatin-like phospholipase/acyl hydrolase